MSSSAVDESQSFGHRRSFSQQVTTPTANYRSLNDKMSHIEEMLRRIQ